MNIIQRSGEPEGKLTALVSREHFFKNCRIFQRFSVVEQSSCQAAASINSLLLKFSCSNFVEKIYNLFYAQHSWKSGNFQILTVILRNVSICSSYSLLKIVSQILTILSILNLYHGLNKVIVFLFMSFGDICIPMFISFAQKEKEEKEELVIPNGSTNSTSRTGLERCWSEHYNQSHIQCHRLSGQQKKLRQFL